MGVSDFEGRVFSGTERSSSPRPLTDSVAIERGHHLVLSTVTNGDWGIVHEVRELRYARWCMASNEGRWALIAHEKAARPPIRP